VWNRRNLELCQQAGLSHAVAIGAPFLYLPEAGAPSPPPQRRLIAVPLHSWEKEKIPQDFERYAESLSEIAHHFAHVTVSLYWYDFQQPAHRAVFERRGFAVVTAGPRDSNPHFLRDQRALLLQHSHLTSNRVQTGLFYGLALGLRGFLHGPPMGVEARIDRSGALFDAWQRQTFGGLVVTPQQLEQGTLPDLQALGLAELGAEFVRSPAELRALLLWAPGDRAALTRLRWDFHVRQADGWRSRLWRRWQRAQALRK
jgi:hypothetical protein